MEACDEPQGWPEGLCKWRLQNCLGKVLRQTAQLSLDPTGKKNQSKGLTFRRKVKIPSLSLNLNVVK